MLTPNETGLSLSLSLADGTRKIETRTHPEMIRAAGGRSRAIAVAVVALLGIALVSPTRAQERMSSATLPQWRLTGEAPEIDDTSGAVVLRSASQLSRAYSGNRIAVRLVTRPYFSASNENLPSLEIGPASVSFLRDPGGGGVVLVGGVAVRLPETLELDANGRSVRSLDLRFIYDGRSGEAKLAFGGATHLVPTGTHLGGIEVVFSAGADADWMISEVEVEDGGVAADPVDGRGEIADGDSDASDDGEVPAEVFDATRAIDPKTIDAALLLIEAGSVEGAASLLGDRTATPGSLAWYLAAAQALLVRAEELKAAGEYVAVRQVSSAATTLMEHGLKAAGEAAQPGERAEVFAQLGYIADDHLGNRAVARQNLTRALEEFPDHALARGSLARFDEEDQRAQRVRGKEDGS